MVDLKLKAPTENFLIKLRDLYYILIPICCIAFWAFIALHNRAGGDSKLNVKFFF